MSRFVASWILVAVCAASVRAGDAYEVTTPGAPGSGGVVPALAGEGSAVPGSANTLLLSDALPHAPALLVFSVSELAAPFAGGVLGPAPDFVASLGITDADGALEKRFRMPENAPVGLELWMQAWVRDAGGAAGFAASNTLKVTVRAEVPVELMLPAALVDLGFGIADFAAGDIDLDGRDDLIVVRSSTPSVRVRRNAGDGSFEEPFTILSQQAVSVALGDVNGDGDLDVVVGMQAMPRAEVLLGDGAGNFAAGPSLVLPALPTHVWLADLDGDDALDLVASHTGSADLSVRLGLGDGDFGAVLPHAPGGALAALTVADLNGDGTPDLVGAVTPFVFPLQQNIAVSLGNGDGTFAAAVLTPTGGATAHDVAVVDLDGDGHADVVTAKQDAEGVTWHRGIGDGALSPPQVLPTGTDPMGLLASDLDGDGFADLVVANHGSNDLSVFRVVAGGGVAPQPDLIPTGIGPRLLAALELQGDDCTDLASLDTFEFLDREVISLHLGAGAGTFHAATSQAVSPSTSSIALVDLDADGVLDAVTTNPTNDRILVMLGQGGGLFGPKLIYDTDPQLGGLVAGDIDGDARPELIVSLQGGRLQVFDVAEDGTLGDSESVDVGVSFISHFRLGDLDADGDLDLIGSAGNEPLYWMLLNAGAGVFGAPVHVDLEHPAGHVTLHDLDGDGLLDFVLTHASLALRVHLNLGDASFSEGDEYPLSGSEFFSSATLVGDLDEDGAPDLVSTPYSGPGAVAVHRGLGDGSFATPQFFDTLAAPIDQIGGAALLDLDGDGHLDLVGGRTDVLVMRGDGQGALAPALQFGAGGELGRMVASDVDGDGASDLVVVSFTSGGGLMFASARLSVMWNLRAP